MLASAVDQYAVTGGCPVGLGEDDQRSTIDGLGDLVHAVRVALEADFAGASPRVDAGAFAVSPEVGDTGREAVDHLSAGAPIPKMPATATHGATTRPTLGGPAASSAAGGGRVGGPAVGPAPGERRSDDHQPNCKRSEVK